MIYLDNAATTKLHPEARCFYVDRLACEAGNAGSLHRLGADARKCLEESRELVSQLFGCEQENVLFTSGGSEGNNLAVRGVLPYMKYMHRKKILVSAAEHDSVVRAAQASMWDGAEVDIVPVNEEGIVDPRMLEPLLSEDVGLVSIMYVNNELGSVNDIKELASMCHSHGVLFHTDCVQAAGFERINVRDVGCDFATVSAHKFHGPMGVGAVYVLDKEKLSPIVFGGEQQEYGLRGGTENVPAIATMGFVCGLILPEMEENIRHISTIKQVFYTELLSRLREAGLDDIVSVNGPPVVRPGRILNLRFSGVDNEALVLALSASGVCISAGSACRARSVHPSRVLTAIGLTDDEARSSVRVSFSIFNTEEEAFEAARIMSECVRVLRKMG